MIISFSKTVNELITGKKWVTRRTWKDSYADKFKPMTIHEAWSALPYVKNAKRIGWIQIHMVYKERLYDMDKYGFKWESKELIKKLGRELIAEGGMCKTYDEFYKLISLPPESEVWVIRFKFFKNKSEALEG